VPGFGAVLVGKNAKKSLGAVLQKILSWSKLRLWYCSKKMGPIPNHSV